MEMTTWLAFCSETTLLQLAVPVLSLKQCKGIIFTVADHGECG